MINPEDHAFSPANLPTVQWSYPPNVALREVGSNTSARIMVAAIAVGFSFEFLKDGAFQPVRKAYIDIIPLLEVDTAALNALRVQFSTECSFTKLSDLICLSLADHSSQLFPPTRPHFRLPDGWLAMANPRA